VTAIRIRDIGARAVIVPFRHPPLTGAGPIPAAAMVLVDLLTDQEIVGRCYLVAYMQSMLKPIVASIEALQPLVQGEALSPIDVDRKLRQRFALFDTPGALGLALAAVDMCIWDALAKARGVPLATLLGGTVRPIRAYNSCGLWLRGVDGLPDEAEALAAEGGFGAVKLRLGRDDPLQDLAAVTAVMKRVGGSIAVMSDYNQRLTLNEALHRCRMLDGEGLCWIEEPVRHDRHDAYAQLCAQLRTPVQTGENLRGPQEMAAAIAARSLDYVMPDVQRIGGVTGWLRAAALAHAHGIEMSSHLFPEFSAHLLAVTPTCHYLEYVDWAAPVLRDPVRISDGCAVVPAERPGAGIEWDEEAVKRFLVA
jgi:mandelate racemase